MSEEDSTFDKVIETVGNDGYFQKRFNWIFNFVLVFFAAMPYMNMVLALHVPDHWCKVPGRLETNYSEAEWKDLHIPKINVSSKIIEYEKCQMYNRSFPYDHTTGPLEIIDCQNGWDFDTSWYKWTAPMQEEWVCKDAIHPVNALVSVRVGEVIGTITFGQLADIIGRRPVFYMTIVTTIFGRVLSTVTSGWVSVFFLLTLIGSLPSTSIFQGPLVIAMEVSRSDDRAHIAMLQCIGWTFGLCALPIVMWAVGDWVYFLLITSAPCGLYLFSQKFLIESPRWLANKGKIDSCMHELERIAKLNKVKVPENTRALLNKCNHSSEKSLGVLSMFSSWRLAKNCAMILIGWSTTVSIYLIVILNSGNIGGNPFMNFFFQSLAELPSYVIGKIASDKLGRRFTSVIAFVGSFVGCIILIAVINDPDQAILVSIISVFLKFSISFAWYVINLQGLEIYPTCVRQTGIALGGLAGNSFGILTPYIIHLGNEIDLSYPYILSAILAGIGLFTSVFLPETSNKKLPETLAEAAVFGEDQDWFGRVKKSKENNWDESEQPLKTKIIN